MAPTEVLCGSRPHKTCKVFATQLLLVPAEMKTNSSRKIAKSGMFVSGKLLFAHLIFWSIKKHSLLPYLVVSSHLFKLKQGRILYAFFFETSSYPLAKAVWLVAFGSP